VKQARNQLQIFNRKSVSRNTTYHQSIPTATNANRWNVERLKQGQLK